MIVVKAVHSQNNKPDFFFTEKLMSMADVESIMDKFCNALANSELINESGIKISHHPSYENFYETDVLLKKDNRAEIIKIRCD